MSDHALYSGPPRLHVALSVRNLQAGIAFYTQLLGVAPSKVRDDYAKFEPVEPAVNLTLNVCPQPVVAPHPSHFGIQVASREAYQATYDRLHQAGLIRQEETATDCCYARQDKVWAYDADGHAWELFLVTEADVDSCSASGDTGQECCAPAAMPAPAATKQTGCCDPSSGCC